MTTFQHLVPGDRRLLPINARLLGALLSVGAVASATGLWAGNDRDHRLAVEGERWWTTSPDPASPVACATCHHAAAAIRGWAASFPKFRPLPRPTLA